LAGLSASGGFAIPGLAVSVPTAAAIKAIFQIMQGSFQVPVASLER
jgi:hypothetical protein